MNVFYMWDGYESLEARGKIVVDWNVPSNGDDSIIPMPGDITFYGKRKDKNEKKKFEDVIWLRILSYELSSWALNPVKLSL